MTNAQFKTLFDALSEANNLSISSGVVPGDVLQVNVNMLATIICNSASSEGQRDSVTERVCGNLKFAVETIWPEVQKMRNNA